MTGDELKNKQKKEEKKHLMQIETEVWMQEKMSWRGREKNKMLDFFCHLLVKYAGDMDLAASGLH